MDDNMNKKSKGFSLEEITRKMHQLQMKYKIKYVKLMNKVDFHMCLQIALIKSTAGNRTRFFPSPFLVYTGCFFILAEAFRNDPVAACSIALRSATEKEEMGGYVTVPCSSKTT